MKKILILALIGLMCLGATDHCYAQSKKKQEEKER